LSSFAEGGGSAVACLSPPKYKRIVISTEATDGFIVRRAVERSPHLLLLLFLLAHLGL
jgi:hypothetical protein